MTKLKVIIAALCFLLGFGVAVFQAFQACWLSAISALVLGPTVGVALFLGVEASHELIYVQGLLGFACILGILAVFFEHRAFETKRTEAHVEVLTAFIKMDIACPIMNNKLREIQREGILACAQQDNSDRMSALTDLQKAKSFGPTLSLIDSVGSAANEPDADWCEESFRVARVLCPEAFISVPESSQQLLLGEEINMR